MLFGRVRGHFPYRTRFQAWMLLVDDNSVIKNNANGWYLFTSYDVLASIEFLNSVYLV